MMILVQHNHPLEPIGWRHFRSLTFPKYFRSLRSRLQQFLPPHTQWQSLRKTQTEQSACE